MSRKYCNGGRPPGKRGSTFRGGHTYKDVGFDSYQQYLSSDLWSQIRCRQLKRYPKCCVCGCAATQVHHVEYAVPVMGGECDELLVSVCRGCHINLEFEGEAKRKIRESRELLVSLLNKASNAEVIERIASGFARLPRLIKKLKRSNTDNNGKRLSKSVRKKQQQIVGARKPKKQKVFSPPETPAKLPTLTFKKAM